MLAWNTREHHTEVDEVPMKFHPFPTERGPALSSKVLWMNPRQFKQEWRGGVPHQRFDFQVGLGLGGAAAADPPRGRGVQGRGVRAPGAGAARGAPGESSRRFVGAVGREEAPFPEQMTVRRGSMSL